MCDGGVLALFWGIVDIELLLVAMACCRSIPSELEVCINISFHKYDAIFDTLSYWMFITKKLMKCEDFLAF